MPFNHSNKTTDNPPRLTNQKILDQAEATQKGGTVVNSPSPAPNVNHGSELD